MREHVAVSHRVIGPLQGGALAPLPHVVLGPGTGAGAAGGSPHPHHLLATHDREFDGSVHQFLDTDLWGTRRGCWRSTNRGREINIHLFSDSEIRSVGCPPKVENESGDSDQSHEEVPEARGHREVLQPPSDEFHHPGHFVPHPDVLKDQSVEASPSHS